MITGYDSYKLSITNLNDINADTINSTTDRTSSLYINGVLIDFGTYITSSYLSSQLANYVSNSTFNSTLSLYVLSSSLSTILNSYATTSALSSYRLISDSYNKSQVWSRDETTNEILIRVGDCGSNNDGSIKTGKQYTDEQIAIVSAATGVNSAAIAALVAWQTTTAATIATIQGQILTIQGQLTTVEENIVDLQTDVTALQVKTQNQTATAGNTKFSGILQMSTGVAENITLNQTGDITCLTETVNTLTCNTELTGTGKINLTNIAQDHVLSGNSLTLSQAGKTTTVYGDTYIGAVGSTVQLYGNNVNIGISNTISNLPVVTIGGIFSTVHLYGAVYINGSLVIPFLPGPSGGQWQFPNS